MHEARPRIRDAFPNRAKPHPNGRIAINAPMDFYPIFGKTGYFLVTFNQISKVTTFSAVN
jgi:hypothetical protein